ncbi:unnamed protein product [Boreogadus saida]
MALDSSARPLLLALGLLLMAPQRACSRPCPRPCSCPQPVELHCTFRSLAAIPTGISNEVERINLGFNSINRLTDRSLSGLGRLELLMVHGNDLHSLPDGAFKDLTSLQMLKLSYNKLTELRRPALHGLWSLARLHLDHNHLTHLHPDSFQGLTSLRVLQLEGNRLRRLHPHTFSTFSLLGHFPISTLRHLYLAENNLTELATATLGGAPQLETLQLQGNPWRCDCGMHWIREWTRNSPGVLKCKKDKEYPGGELCPMCSSPLHLQGKEMQSLDDMVCIGPVIASPLRPSNPEAPRIDASTPDKLWDPLGNTTVGLSDEHGNKVDLVCEVAEAHTLGRVTWEQISEGRLSANLTWSADLDCPIDRENYERLWRLIAYYSDVPAHLQREELLGKDPGRSYRYRQDAERDAQYYTGVKVIVAARPLWLMQPSLSLRLDRPRSTGKKVKLVLSSRITQSVEAVLERGRSRAWVMIGSDSTTATKGVGFVVTTVGGTSRMRCNSRSSGKVRRQWILPDGSRLDVPHGVPDGRVSASSDGELLITSVDHSDAGLYHCVATVPGDLDILPFRLVIEESSGPSPGDDRPQPPPIQWHAGEPITLPCESTAAPDAEIHWILPGRNIVSHRANTSRVFVFSNGSLRVPQGLPLDSGYYKCVAINRHGVDTLAMEVNITRRITQAATRSTTQRKLAKSPQSASGLRTRIKVRTEESVDGSGDDQGGKPIKPDVSRRRGLIPARRAGHPFRTTWRRPLVSRKPVQPRGDGRKPAADVRRRVNVASNKIDPGKWADILAKVRDKTGQNSVTAANTVRETQRSVRNLTFIGQTALSEGNVEGSGEGGAMQEKKEEVLHTTTTTTLTPTRTTSTADYKPSTPRASESKRTTHVTSDTRTNSIHATPDPRRTHNTPLTAVSRNTQLAHTQSTHVTPSNTQSTHVNLSAPVTHTRAGAVQHTTQSTIGSAQITRDENQHPTPLTNPCWQTNTNRASSRGGVTHNDSSQGRHGNYTDTDTDVGVVTTQDATPPWRDVGREEQKGGGREDGGVAAAAEVSGVPLPAAPTRPLSVKFLGRAWTSPPEETTLDGWALITVSPALAGTRERGREGGPRRKRPDLKRKNGGKRRKTKEKRRRQKLNRARQLIAATSISGNGNVSERVGTTSSVVALKIEQASSATAEFLATVPFLDHQVTTTSLRAVSVSHKGSTVCGRDDDSRTLGASAEDSKPPPAATIPSRDKTSPGAMKTMLLSTALSTTPLFSTMFSKIPLPSTATSPYALSSVSTSLPGPGESSDGESSHNNESIRSEASAAGERAFPSQHSNRPSVSPRTLQSTALPAVMPSAATQRVRVPMNRGPVESPTRNPRTLLKWRPDDRKQNQSGTSRDTHSQVAGNKPYGKIRETAPLMPPPPPSSSSSSAPSLQHESSESSGEHNPSGTEGLPGDLPYDGGNTKEKRPTTTKVSLVKGSESLSLDLTGADAAVNEHQRQSPDPWPPSVGSTTAVVTAKRPSTRKALLVKESSSPSMDPTDLDAAFNEGLSQTMDPALGSVGSTPGAVAPTPKATTSSTSNPLISSTALSGVTPTVALAITPFAAGGGTKHFSVPLTTPSPEGSGFNHISDSQVRGTAPGKGQGQGQGGELPPLSPYGQSHYPRNYSKTGLTLPAPRSETQSQNRNAGDLHPVMNLSPDPPSVSDAVPVVPTTTPVLAIPVATEAESTAISRTSSPPGERLPHRERPTPEDRSRPRPGLVPPLPPPRGNPWITRVYGQTVTVDAEADGHLPCEAVGWPHPFLSWTKVSTGGSIAQNTKVNRYEVHPNGSLIIRRAQPTDRGRYLCRVQNQHGEDQVTLDLAVLLQHPRVLQPRHRVVTVASGASVQLDCTVLGHPPPRVTWLLPDATASLPNRRLVVLGNGTLRIAGAEPGDGGIYRCLGSSVAGEDSVTVRLRIEAASAVVELELENVTVVEGATGFLHCSATFSSSSSSSSNVRWIAPSSSSSIFRWTIPDGTQLLATAKTLKTQNLEVLRNGTLKVQGAAPGDSGSYECTAVSEVGTRRRAVFLSVILRPPGAGSGAKARISASSPRAMEVVYGGAVRLDCRASGEPEPRIIWRTPSKKLVDSQYSYDPRIKVLANGSLTVQSVTEEDSGDFLCLVRNRHGDDFTAHRVDVLRRAAKIDRKLLLRSSQEVVIGGGLRVDCVASGLPNPDITWALPDGTMVDAHKLRPGRTRRYIVFDNGTLLFNDVGALEEGDYTCYAENTLGKDQMKVRVKVNIVAEGQSNGHPTPQDPRVIMVTYGGSASLPCGGGIGAKVSWISPTHRVVTPVSGKYEFLGNGTLVVHRVQRSDSGNYTCLVPEGGPSPRTTTALEVLLTPPSINGPSIVMVTATEGVRLLLDCAASGTPRPRVAWVLPGDAVVPVPYGGGGGRVAAFSNGTLELRSPRRVDAGRLTCVARSEGGEARLGVDLRVAPPPSRSTGRRYKSRVAPVMVLNGGPLWLHCPVDSDPPLRLSWTLPTGVVLVQPQTAGRYAVLLNGTLAVRQASPHDHGSYVCRTSDWRSVAVPTVRAEVVVVSHPARITNGPPPVSHAQRGVALQLDCVATGAPRAEVAWETPDRTRLAVGTQPRLYGNKYVHPQGALVIQNPTPRDAGLYRCTARNAVGVDSKQTYLNVS